MNTKRLFSNLVKTGTRLTILASILMTAFMSNVSGVAAAPALSLQTVTVSAQSGVLSAGTAGSATYTVTVTRSSGTPNTTTMSISGLPAGATGSFGTQSAWSPSFGTGTRTVPLTINVTGALTAGNYNFTVQASGQGPDPTGTGTLTISKASQSITFNTTNTDKTLGIPDFNISATASSGLPVSFAAAGGCSVAGSLVHLISLGSCTITASQAGNATYLAAPNVMLTFAIVAPAVACTPTVNKELWAKTGTATLYTGTSVTIWGYSNTAGGVATLPGPVLDVNQGDCVGVTLHNVNIPENTSLLLEGQNIIPDRTGVAAGNSVAYAFLASNPGTFLYEAGLGANGQHQVAMGMYGALLVHPTTPDPAIAQEATLVLSELDPALNNSGSPANFDMRNYNPHYFLINGKAYPDTSAISATSGDTVLLRYVNAGMQAHAMSTLGLSQTLIAQDGFTNAYSHKMVAETIATGQTLDTLVTIPASAPDGAKFALYDANMLLRNNSGAGTFTMGGMLTFIEASSAGGGADTSGPLLSSILLTPNPSDGTVSVDLSFTANDTTTGNSDVVGAEYAIDGGPATPINVGTPGPIVNLDVTIASGLSAGTHVVSVRAQDAAGNWSTTGSIDLVVDNAGPESRDLSLTPNPSNGLANVALSFTADDSASGNSNVTAAEYWIDGGTHQPISVASPSPVKIVNADLTPAEFTGDGIHIVEVRSQDALGNWGASAEIDLVVDNNLGPVTSDVSASPNPNNGSTPYNTSIPAVRVFATFTDTSSNIAAAEGFIDTIAATGTGFVFIANDGNFNSPMESGYSDIPLAVVGTLSTGDHMICVHAKDASGNWGDFDCTTMLTIDKIAPTTISITALDASPTSAASVNWQVTFSENVTGVTSANFSLVQGGGLTGASITNVTGAGTTWTVTASTGSAGGTLGLNLTSPAGITDLAGNTLSSTNLPFVGPTYTLITPPLYFSTSGTTNPPGVGGAADDADIYFWDGAAFSRVIDASVAPYSLPASGGGNANVDGFDRVDATHFYMSFTGQVNVPGIGNVQDEDVVFYNAGSWSLFFDGSAHGISGTDLDAISVVGGTLYFSTDDTDVPPGVSGGGDDADIYSWNGSSYARVFDASVLGWSTANVDGFVFVDATHYYLSYSADTSIPGFGSIQDEDVVYRSGVAWSVYFDGTGKGLTSGNQDVDAFDIP